MNLKNIGSFFYRYVPSIVLGPLYRVANRSWLRCWRFKKRNLGIGSYIDPSVQIIGWEWVRIGRGSVISSDSWIVVNHRSRENLGVKIGDNCHIGRRNFFSCGPSVELADYCMTGVDCRFLGCGHEVDNPFSPYVYAGPSSGGVIRVGANCWLGAGVSIMAGVHIGHGSIIGANSLVLDDIPPFSIAVGSPCSVVKHFNFVTHRWESVRDRTSRVDFQGPAEPEYLDALRSAKPSRGKSLITSGARFGWI